MPKLGDSLNFAKLEAQNMRLQNLTSAPSSPVSGQVYYDSVAGVAYVFDGSGWNAMAADAAAALLTKILTVDGAASGLDADLLDGQHGSYHLDRANHTGTQVAATISDFSAAADARIALVVDAAPGALDTLNELAAALGDDPNFATTVTTALDARLVAASNLSDLASASTARTNLGLGTIATQAASAVAITGGSITGITELAVADGGTGAGTASGARSNLGATGSYSALIGDGSTTAIAVTQATHGLAGNGKILVSVQDATTGEQVWPTIVVNNSNGTVTVTFANAPASNAYRLVLIG